MKSVEAQVRHFKRLDLAAVSLHECRALTEHVLTLGLHPKSEGATLYSACMAGIVTTYARPFMSANGLGPLDKKFEEDFVSDSLSSTHRDILMCRNAVFAHRDLQRAETMTLHPESYPVTYESIIVFSALPNGKASLHSEPALLYIDSDSLPSIVELCAFQIGRINKEAAAILERMAGTKAYRPGKYIVGKDFP